MAIGHEEPKLRDPVDVGSGMTNSRFFSDSDSDIDIRHIFSEANYER